METAYAEARRPRKGRVSGVGKANRFPHSSNRPSHEFTRLLPLSKARLSQEILRGVLAMQVEVHDGDWGKADTSAIQSLLNEVAFRLNMLMRNPFGGHIIVQKHDDDPITYYNDSLPIAVPQGSILMRLNVHGTYWAQFIYQFAHEFCHVLSNYENLRYNPNKWFHEALCETASLYSLWDMGRQWATSPPLSQQTSFASSVVNYVTKHLSGESRALPENITLRNWLLQHENMLQGTDPTKTRSEQHMVANLLWPFFENNPLGWNIIRSLPDSRGNLAEYFEDWRDQVEPIDRDFVSKIRAFIYA